MGQHHIEEHSEPKVLFVDDEPNILQSLRRVMRQENFTVQTAVTPEEALELITQHDFAVVISDQRMPSMRGAELLEKIRRHSPQTIRMILTGYADMQSAMDAINKGGAERYISKPWDDVVLQDTVRDAVSRYQLLRENLTLQETLSIRNAELESLTKNMEQKVFERTREVLELNQHIKQNFNGALNILATLTERHSNVMGSHAKRICEISLSLAASLNMPKSDQEQLRVAALLHDIGSIGLPEEIVKKPKNQRNDYEQRVMEQHPILGASLLEHIPQFKNASAMILAHHEYWDGTGYPHQLKRTQIPLGARIIAVADAYDNALNQQGTYANTTPAQVIRQMEHHANRLYDENVLNELKTLVLDGELGISDTDTIDIGWRDVRTGMVLSKDLVTTTGVLILKKDSDITAEVYRHLEKLFEHDLAVTGLSVYRKYPSHNTSSS